MKYNQQCWRAASSVLQRLNASQSKEDMASLTLRPDDILEDTHMSEGIVIYLKNSGINDIQRYHGGLRRFAPGATLSLNSGFKTSYECIGTPEATDCPRIWKSLWRRLSDGSEKTIKVYSKIIHLVDPIVFQQRSKLLSYVPSPDAEERDQLRRHAISRHNQASVDATICYILSRIGELGLTPHAIQYLDTVCGIANPYNYKITEDYLTLRNSNWFWSLADGGQQLHIEGQVPDEIRHLILTPPKDDDIMCESAISLNSAGDEQEIVLSAEEISSVAGVATVDTELAEVADDFIIGDFSEPPTELIGDGSGSVKGTPLEDAVDAIQISGGEIFLKCPDVPVLVCFQEAADGTMDKLLEDVDEDSGILDDEAAERQWSAWIFQIVAALSLYQRYIRFCHNDLHTNNIVWIPTEEQFVYYKDQNDVLYKVPTYGRIFKIIDFGRATCEIGKKKIMSSDFAEGEDGFGQYNWGPFYNPDLPEVAPNPSFDLCRLAVSLFENLCPDEESRQDSPLAALLWKWMEDDGGNSVLYTEDGEERFPGFELYVHIAAHCRGAVPAAQFREKPFSQFRVRGKRAKELSAKVRAYPIFETSAADDI